MKFTIYGEPIAQKRPRMGKHSVYDPDYYQKVLVKKQMIAAIKDCKNEDYASVMEADAISANITAYFLPKGEEKKNNSAYWGLSACKERKDLDNICKFYFDCANGILFKDDRFIVHVLIEKKYHHIPRVEIEFMPKKQNEDIDIDRYSETIFCFRPHEFNEFINRASQFKSLIETPIDSLPSEQKKAWYETAHKALFDLIVNHQKTLNKIHKNLSKL